MEDISKYLDNLFAQLPNTPEARHAREELGQMMEDRYAELCAKGMGEKDAASAAIAEFGSLEEVRESLGLGAQPAAAQPADAQPAAAQPAAAQPADAQPACQRPAVASAPAAQAAPPRPQGTSGPVPPRVEQQPRRGSASPNSEAPPAQTSATTADAALFSLHASLSRQSSSRPSRGTESPPASAARLGMAHPSARARRRARRAR